MITLQHTNMLQNILWVKLQWEFQISATEQSAKYQNFSFEDLLSNQSNEGSNPPWKERDTALDGAETKFSPGEFSPPLHGPSQRGFIREESIFTWMFVEFKSAENGI